MDMASASRDPLEDLLPPDLPDLVEVEAALSPLPPSPLEEDPVRSGSHISGRGLGVQAVGGLVGSGVGGMVETTSGTGSRLLPFVDLEDLEDLDLEDLLDLPN